MSDLRKRMIREMQLRNFSSGTQENSLYAVSDLAKYYHRSPDKIDAEEIKNYLIYLLTKRKYTAGSCQSIISGLRFFYNVVLGCKLTSVSIPTLKQEKHLPEILNTQELERLFCATNNPKHRVLITTYNAGLRVSEVVQLKVTDIHSERMLIRVNQDKGKKDRYAILSRRLLREMREYWKIKRPPVWLFPGRESAKPLTVRSAQIIYAKAIKKAEIKHRGGSHTLKHCFATHLLEAGTDYSHHPTFNGA